MPSDVPFTSSLPTMIALLILLFFGASLIKGLLRFLDVLLRIILWALTIGILLAYFYLITWGSATFALLAIVRERKGRSSKWPGILSVILLPVSLYMLTRPDIRDRPWLYHQMAQGTAAAVLLILCYLAILLYGLSKKGLVGGLAGIALLSVTIWLTAMGLLAYDRYWHTSKLALANGDAYTETYRDFKREKYRNRYESFLKSHRKIAVTDIKKTGGMQRYMAKYRDKPFASDSLIIERFNYLVGVIYYTEQFGFNKKAAGVFINGQDGDFRDDDFHFNNPERDPGFEYKNHFQNEQSNGFRVKRELSMQAFLVEANIDEFIRYCEENTNYFSEPGHKVYLSLEYMRRKNIPVNPPTVSQLGSEYLAEGKSGLFGRIY